MSMKNSSNTIGNRTRHLSACNAVSQPSGSLHINDSIRDSTDNVLAETVFTDTRDYIFKLIKNKWQDF